MNEKIETELEDKKIHEVVDFLKSEKLTKKRYLRIFENPIFTPREIKIFFMRWGVGGEREMHGLSDVGKYFGVTRERIRQLERRLYLKIYDIHLNKEQHEKNIK